MNYMSEVAKMLGVELLEEFEIVFPNSTCRATAWLNNEGLYIDKHNLANQDYWKLSALTNLLNGKYIIKRKPWKPHTDETYYFVDEDGIVCEDVWLDVSDDILLYKCGNCYKTYAEAAQYENKWLEFFKSDKMLEV